MACYVEGASKESRANCVHKVFERAGIGSSGYGWEQLSVCEGCGCPGQAERLSVLVPESARVALVGAGFMVDTAPPPPRE